MIHLETALTVLYQTTWNLQPSEIRRILYEFSFKLVACKAIDEANAVHALKRFGIDYYNHEGMDIEKE